MPLQIERYPHAHYDFDSRQGWLCEYYQLNQPSKDQWRKQSYSPEILNYKVGENHRIGYFLSAYIQLLEHVRTAHDAKFLYVVPVPASTPESDAGYTTVAKPDQMPRKNRDNRNNVFCDLIHENYGKGMYEDLVLRVKPKTEKARLTAEEHADSMALRDIDCSFDEDEDLLVLVDDVTTTGGSIDGAMLLLSTRYSANRIVRLPIAKTTDPLEFRSIFP